MEIDEQIFVAVKAGDLESVQMALKSGIDPNVRDKYKETPLIYAAQGPSLPVVKELLAHGANINFRGEKGWTPLRYAIDKRRDDIAKYLIASGADINSKATDGETPLYGAVFKNNEEIVRLLLALGADVNVITKGNSSCLAIAVSYPDNLAIVRLLIEAGADLSFRPADILSNAIFTSAAYGGTGVVEYLLDSGMGNSRIFIEEKIEFLEKFCSDKKGAKAVIDLLKGRKQSD